MTTTLLRKGVPIYPGVCLHAGVLIAYMHASYLCERVFAHARLCMHPVLVCFFSLFCTLNLAVSLSAD